MLRLPVADSPAVTGLFPYPFYPHKTFLLCHNGAGRATLSQPVTIILPSCDKLVTYSLLRSGFGPYAFATSYSATAR